MSLEEDEVGSSSSSASEEEEEESDSGEEAVGVYACGGDYGDDYDPWAQAIWAKQLQVIGGGVVPGASNLKVKHRKKDLEKVMEHRERKPKKSVSFGPPGSLVAIRDISPRPGSPLSEELEPCDPEKLGEDQDEMEVKGPPMTGNYNVRKSHSNRNVVARITGLGSYGNLQRTETKQSLNKITSKRPNAARHGRSGRGSRGSAGSPRKPQSSGKTPPKTAAPRQDSIRLRSYSANDGLYRRAGLGGGQVYPGDRRPRASSARPLISMDRRPLVSSDSPLKVDGETMPFSHSFSRVHPSPYRMGSANSRRYDPGTCGDNGALNKELRELRLGAGFSDVSDLKIDARMSANSTSKKMYAWHLANGTLQGSSQLETPCISQLWDSANSKQTLSPSTKS